MNQITGRIQMDNGNRRRASDNSPNIHELIIRIDENVKSMKENHCQHLQDCVAHRESYDEKFNKISDTREKDLCVINKRFIPLEQDRWKIVGAITVILVLLKFIPTPWK
jgi:hypothetical protein